MLKRGHRKHREHYSSRQLTARRDDYDRVWQLEREAEQSLWDEAQDEALRSAAERFNEHTEDVP